MKAIILGANGRDGYYLSESRSKRQIEAIGISRSGPWVHGEVSSSEIAGKLTRNHQLARVLHLAAASSTKRDAIYKNSAIIGTGTINNG